MDRSFRILLIINDIAMRIQNFFRKFPDEALSGVSLFLGIEEI